MLDFQDIWPFYTLDLHGPLPRFKAACLVTVASFTDPAIAFILRNHRHAEILRL